MSYEKSKKGGLGVKRRGAKDLTDKKVQMRM